MEVDPKAKTRITEATPDPFVGRTVDGFRIEELIGRGGMGTVYRATQLSLSRSVALKILPETLLGDAHFRERFHREAEVLSKLTHPNIVTVFERGEVDGRPFLVMEFVEGTNLREVLRQGPLPQAEALQMLSSLLAALEHAHRHGIVHRDIKPENILLTRNSVPKVADFGLSRMLGPEELTRLTRSHLMLGTYEYMAPEQREHAKEADERSDLYATGVVLYEMLLGELPIGRFELPSQKRPDECDRRVDAIIERSLDKNPDRRFQRASEMGDAVSAILERPQPEPPLAQPEGEQEPLLPPDFGDKPRAYRPMRFEAHIDNIATINTALGTVCYAVGFMALFGLFPRAWGGFVLFFVAGWYLRETADQLRKYRAPARSAQAVISIACCLTGVLFIFGYYSLWALFGPKGRTYYQARSRGMNEEQAARHAYRILEEPFPQPPPAPPPKPQAPTPSQIPVQSIATSQVEPWPHRRPHRVARQMRRVSPFLRGGLLLGVLAGLGALTLLIVNPSSDWLDDKTTRPIFAGIVVLIVIGLLHTIVRGLRR